MLSGKLRKGARMPDILIRCPETGEPVQTARQSSLKLCQVSRYRSNARIADRHIFGSQRKLGCGGTKVRIGTKFKLKRYRPYCALQGTGRRGGRKRRHWYSGRISAFETSRSAFSRTLSCLRSNPEAGAQAIMRSKPFWPPPEIMQLVSTRRGLGSER
jgi:hypothetical protein